MAWRVAGCRRRVVVGGDDPRCPSEFGLAIGFVALFALTTVVMHFRSSLGLGGAAAVEAGAVAVLAWAVRPVAAVASGGLAWLFLTSFVVDRDEQLRWHGHGDLIRLAVVLTAAVAVTTVRSAQLALRRRYRTQLGEWQAANARSDAVTPSIGGDRA